LLIGRQECGSLTLSFQQTQEILKQRLSECLEKDEKGQSKMTIQLPDEAFLDNMAKSLSQILGTGSK
jgi:hypothetical protein